MLAPYRDIVRLFHLEREGAFTYKNFPDVVNMLGVWDKIYRREFIEKHKLAYLEKRIYEDHLFSFQSLVLAEKISIVSQPLYYYRKNAGGSITELEVSTAKSIFCFE